MAELKKEHRNWITDFLKHATGGSPTTSPDVLRAGPGFGNNPRVLDPTDFDKKEPLPEKSGRVVTSEGYLVKSVTPDSDVKKSFNDFTTKVVKNDKDALALHAKLDALDKQEKQVRDFVAANSKNLEAEVSANQSDSIKNVARDMEQEREHFQLVTTVLSSLKLNVEDAKSRLESAQLKLASIQNLEEARRLSEKIQQQTQKMDSALSFIGNAIEGGVALATGNPAGVIKPIYDAITAIGKLKKENPLAKEVEQNRRAGTDKAIQAANIDIDAALKIIDTAGSLAESTEKQQIKGYEHYIEMRNDVETLYDGSTKGKFKFADLAKHLKWLDDSANLALQTYEADDRAYFYADGLRDIYRAVIDQMKPQGPEFTEGQLVLKDLAGAHAKRRSAANSKMKQFAALRRSLELMRDTATQKLAHAPLRKAVKAK